MASPTPAAETVWSLQGAVKALVGGNPIERATIEKLYGFLDILDKKSGTICTINSLIFTVNGLVFKSAIDNGAANAAANLRALYVPAEAATFIASNVGWILTLCGLIAIPLSLFTLVNSLNVNSMRWPFLWNAQLFRDGAASFDKEIAGLCTVLEQRTEAVRRQGNLTKSSIVITCLALLITLLMR